MENTGGYEKVAAASGARSSSTRCCLRVFPLLSHLGCKAGMRLAQQKIVSGRSQLLQREWGRQGDCLPRLAGAAKGGCWGQAGLLGAGWAACLRPHCGGSPRLARRLLLPLWRGRDRDMRSGVHAPWLSSLIDTELLRCSSLLRREWRSGSMPGSCTQGRRAWGDGFTWLGAPAYALQGRRCTNKASLHWLFGCEALRARGITTQQTQGKTGCSRRLPHNGS